MRGRHSHRQNEKVFVVNEFHEKEEIFNIESHERIHDASDYKKTDFFVVKESDNEYISSMQEQSD